MSIISTTITNGITLGNPGYLSPLTISPAGAVLPSAEVVTGIYDNIGGLSLSNLGQIAAGPGTVGVGLYQGINQARGSGPGGTAILFTAAGNVSNLGVVAGGYGGVGQDNTTGGGIGGQGGIGGYAIKLTAGGSFSNPGMIFGGSGGHGGSGGPAGYASITYGGGYGGHGGSGAYLNGFTASNRGTISGGDGGTGGNGGGQGGLGARYGVEALGGIFTNTGFISGGAGGAGGSAGRGGGVGGDGGIAILESGGTLSNTGLLEGGAGGNAGDGSTMNLVIGTLDLGTQGGHGGIGAELSGGIMINLAQGDILGGGGGSAGPNHADGGGGGAGLRISNGTMTNFGAIIGGGGAPGSNGGTMGAGGAGVQLLGGTLVNAGLIEGGNGAAAVLGLNSNMSLVIEPGASFIGAVIGATNYRGADYFNVINFATGGISLNLYNSFQNIAEAIIDTGAIVTLSGELTAEAIVNDGTIDADAAGPLTITGPLTGAGVIIDDPTTITLNGQAAAGQTVSLDGPGDVLILGDPSQFAGTITNFQMGDTIDLTGFSASSETYVSGTGLVLSDGTSTITLDIQGNFPSGTIAVSSGAGGTQLELCFLRGTRILTPSGERAVEDLRPGDLVVTRNSGFQPVKWIGAQRYDPRFIANRPVRIKSGALGEYLPARDLIVSPGHSLLLDGVLVLARNLVNGITIVHETSHDMIEYFGIELRHHDCLLAQGSWAESFADGPGLRRQFHNFEDFLARFPDYEEPPVLSLCAPRPEHGPVLAAALRPVVSRAAALTQRGTLRGWIDVMRPDGLIEGWAQDIANPELPVLLEFLRGEQVIATALACEYRGDLAEAGIGMGYAKFSIMLPGGEVRVRQAGTQDVLVWSDACRQRRAA